MSDHRLGRILSLLALVVAVGCSPKIPKAVPIAGNLTAAAQVNPDVSGRASPVAVKVYQLRSAGTFESSDFFKLYTQPAAALGADLVSSTEIMVRPGETKRFDQEIDPQTRFVGVVAGFRDVENAQWRAVAPVPAADDLPERQLEVSLKNLTAAAAFTKSR